MRNTGALWGLVVVTIMVIIAGGAAPRGPVGQTLPAPVGYPVAMPPNGFAVRVLFGLKDTEPHDWSGEVKVSEGKVVRLEAPLGAEERIEGGVWKLYSSRLGGPNAPVRPVSLIITLAAPPTARITVTTKQGNFSSPLGDIAYGQPKLFLTDAVALERVPLSSQLTNQSTEDDFPASAVASDGTIWCAYVAYRKGNPILPEAVNRGRFDSLVTKGHGDQVKLMRFDGKEWGAPLDVTPPGLDVWRPAVAVDGQGRVWAVWSQNVEADWELYARSYDPKLNRWSDARRLTSSAGADINVAAATDSSGRVWIAWQSWVDGAFQIKRRRLDRAAQMSPVTITRGDANNWSPSVVADSKGRVYIAWDHYSEGNYDVALERLDTKTGQSTRIPLTRSTRCEARPSLTVDKQDRVWVAYEEGDANWGKDYGTRWEGKSGVPFYADVDGKGRRDLRVRVVIDGKVMQPAGDLDAALSELLRIRKSFPRLGVDDAGRVWLTFRHHGTQAHAAVRPAAFAQELWSSWATYYDGRQWTPPRWIPNSTNLLDNRPAVVPWRGMGALLLYSSDERTGSLTTAKTNHIHAARLAAGGSPSPAELVAATVPEDKAEPVHPNERDDIARIRRYRVRLGGKTYQPLRGEFHRHTELSSHRDQDGPFEELWRYGLDVARMDWIGPGDHDNGVGADNMSREYTWWLTQKQVDMYFHPPTFMPMFTYERSVIYPSGHRNVMFDRRGIRPLPRAGTVQQPDVLFGSPERGAPDVKNLYAYLKHFGGICSSHTSATRMGTDWRDHDALVEPVVEIYQGHRQNYEEPHAPMAARGADDSIGGYAPDGFVWNAFQKGYRLGFQVSSDHVSTHLSYAIVYAEEPTRAAILDAFKRRHSYGAQDNIILDVRCGDQMMGDEFTLKTLPKLAITVQGTAPVARVDIIRQIDREAPRYVHAFEPNTREVQRTWMDNAAKPGAVNMYYVRIQQKDGKLAWASPLWVTYAP